MIRRLATGALAVGAGLCFAGAAAAETVEQLKDQLKQRDAAIDDLSRRIRALEEKAGETTPQTAAEPSAGGSTDEELLNRALERSLVLTGGVLLPQWKFELEPGAQYAYTRKSGLQITGPGTVAFQDMRRDELWSSLRFRAGLPWTSQFELAVPYGYERVETTTAGNARSEESVGVGDLRVGLSKQFLAERDSAPALLGNVTWQPATGSSNLNRIINPPSGAAVQSPSLGSGFESVSTSLTAVKRKDPLVFMGTLWHGFNFATELDGSRVSPGDSNGGNFQTILAVSPDLSLRGGLSVDFTGDTRIDGRRIDGSNQTVGMLQLGGASVLTDRMLLDVTAGAGLTSDAPDFVVGVSLPIRF